MTIAICIEGVRNSGKSSTLRKLVTRYSHNLYLNRMRRGWQRIALNKDFLDLSLDSYFFPASPSETETQLEKFLKKRVGMFPNVLFVAEQIGGERSQETKDFLKNNYDQVFIYTLSNKNGDDIWDRFDAGNMEERLEARSDKVVEEIRGYLLKKSKLFLKS